MASSNSTSLAGGSGVRRVPRAFVYAVTAAIGLGVLLYMSGWTASPTLRHLAQWSPALLSGFGMNILISVVAMSLGTLVGLAVGILRVSSSRILQIPARIYIQVWRNAPWLVLIYFATYVFPFEIKIASTYLPFSDWIKAALGLALPASANIAEIFRGAIQSIPATQWEASRSLALKRLQIFRWIIVPQCVRRMLPSWMNLYAMITMGTALASLVGVRELLGSAQIAANTANDVPFTILAYIAVLTLFFIYCYPISRLTIYLERRNVRS